MAKTKTKSASEDTPKKKSPDVRIVEALIALMESPGVLLSGPQIEGADAALKEMETAGIAERIHKGRWQLTSSFRILAKRASRGSKSRWAEIRSHQ